MLAVAAALLVSAAVGCAAVVASASFDRAVDAFERSDYPAAIARLEHMTQSGADSARVRTLLGWSYYRIGQLPRAQAEFERSLRMDPRDLNAYYAHEGLGWIALKQGDADRARSAFAEALRLSPGYHNALNGVGWAYLAKGDFVRAEASFRSALERVPGDADARRGLGFVAYRRGDWRQAIERLSAVLRDNESDTLTRSALGWSHYYNGEHPAARKLFEEVARREPDWADPLLGFGWIAERQGRVAEAKSHFRAAVRKSAAYVAAGAPGTALRGLLAARADWLDLWHELGWGLFHQRAFALAEAEFRALLARHPAEADGVRGLGYSLNALKKYRESLEPLERAVATGGSLPPVRERVEIPGATGLHDIVSDATSTLAWSQYHLGNYTVAQRLFRSATTAHPDWVDAWSGLGWTLARMGDRAGAEAAFRRSLSLKPGYPDATAGLQRLGQRTP
jgi:tetratricopeptide (TPR) repeat protein